MEADLKMLILQMSQVKNAMMWLLAIECSLPPFPPWYPPSKEKSVLLKLGMHFHIQKNNSGQSTMVNS